jgi:hypothetical protein
VAINAGLSYENQVRYAVRQAARSIPHLSVSSIGGKTQASVPDLTLILPNGRFPVEIKLNGRAQMGNPMNVLYKNGEFDVRHDDTVDAGVEEMVLEALAKKKRDFDRFLDFVSSVKPAYNLQADSIPVTCSKKAWDLAVTRGLVRGLNSRVRTSSDVISRWYQKKGVHYIQIGDQGLFHMGRNPLRLPVPDLRGDVDMEIRLAHHGAKPNKLVGSRVTGDLRCIARLIAREKSEFSIDNQNDVVSLFGRGGKH